MINENVRDYIENLRVMGSVPGLDAIKCLLQELDNPQDKVKIIHVAGTNGKGSIVSYISSILQEASYKTGVFMSPAVFDYYEMYNINGHSITAERYEQIGKRVIDAVKKVNEKGVYPTSFEIETVLAYEYFYQEKCDIAVIETGMGGDLDATNVTKSALVSVIASISKDHTSFLGDTVEEIAAHKAGIIKPDSEVVIMAGQKKEVMDILLKKAAECRANVTVTEPAKILVKAIAYPFQVFTYKEVENITLAMLGIHQRYNALCAVETIHILNKRYGFNIGDDIICSALRKVVLHGRFEKIGDEPMIVLDGAHNEGAALVLRNNIINYFDQREITFILGMFKDKDYETVLNIMGGLCHRAITVTPPGERGLDSEILKDAFCKYNSEVIVSSYGRDYEGAVKEAISNTEKTGVIVVFGSLSFLGEIKNCVSGGE